jgi:hypothetical protein
MPRTPRKYIFGAFRGWLVSWMKLFCGLLGVLSLGHYVPDWDTDLSAEFLMSYMNKWTEEHRNANRS